MKFFKKIRLANEISKLKEKLNDKSPRAVFYDMCHFFNEQKIRNGKIDTTIFSGKIEKQHYHVFLPCEYTDKDPQKQIFLHGMLYKILCDLYATHLKKYPQKGNNGTTISNKEYEKLPKQYRGLFFKKGNKNYVLNASTDNMAIACNKKNRQKLDELLNRAKNLIPFVWNSFAPKELAIQAKPSDPQGAFQEALEKQIKIIEELHGIFVEIAKISAPIEIKAKRKTTASVLYECYRSDIRKNRFLEGQKQLKSMKKDKDKQMSELKEKYETDKKYIEEAYKGCHDALLTEWKHTIKQNMEKCR